MKKTEEHEEKDNLGKDHNADIYENNDSSQSSTSLAASECELLHKRHNCKRQLLEEIELVPDNVIRYYSDRSNFY